jgi:hypothetical protein
VCNILLNISFEKPNYAKNQVFNSKTLVILEPLSVNLKTDSKTVYQQLTTSSVLKKLFDGFNLKFFLIIP